MDKKEVLTKAIQKAIDGGYEPDSIENVTSFKATIRNGQAWVRWFNDDGLEVIQDIEHVIYSHDFANALWPDTVGKTVHESEETIEDERGKVHRKDVWEVDCPAWQYHLQQMVIADDPIKYLGENI